MKSCCFCRFFKKILSKSIAKCLKRVYNIFRCVKTQNLLELWLDNTPENLGYEYRRGKKGFFLLISQVKVWSHSIIMVFFFGELDLLSSSFFTKE